MKEEILILASLAQAYCQNGDKSMITLCNENKIFNSIDHVNLKDLQSTLSDHPGLAKFWLTISEDQRSDESWFIEDYLENQFRVAFRTNSAILNETIFSNFYEACSRYIYCYIKNIQAIKFTK